MRHGHSSYGNVFMRELRHLVRFRTECRSFLASRYAAPGILLSRELNKYHQLLVESWASDLVS